MSLAWGNASDHTEAFREALREFLELHPDAPRRFIDLRREEQSLILDRSLKIYQKLIEPQHKAH